MCFREGEFWTHCTGNHGSTLEWRCPTMPRCDGAGRRRPSRPSCRSARSWYTLTAPAWKLYLNSSGPTYLPPMLNRAALGIPSILGLFTHWTRPCWKQPSPRNGYPVSYKGMLAHHITDKMPFRTWGFFFTFAWITGWILKRHPF